MVFGEKPKNFRYVVIVCPKCRQHAQITETGKETLRCQHCGTILQARRLRISHSFEELTDAVAFRTRLQAEISGKGSGTFSLGPSANEHEISKFETENKAKTFELPENRDSAKIFSKKDRKSIFLELLGNAGGKMGIEELQKKALEKGISPEKFDVTLKTLLETGEIYSPESGMIKLV